MRVPQGILRYLWVSWNSCLSGYQKIPWDTGISGFFPVSQGIFWYLAVLFLKIPWDTLRYPGIPWSQFSCWLKPDAAQWAAKIHCPRLLQKILSPAFQDLENNWFCEPRVRSSWHSELDKHEADQRSWEYLLLFYVIAFANQRSADLNIQNLINTKLISFVFESLPVSSVSLHVTGQLEHYMPLLLSGNFYEMNPNTPWVCMQGVFQDDVMQVFMQDYPPISSLLDIVFEDPSKQTFNFLFCWISWLPRQLGGVQSFKARVWPKFEDVLLSWHITHYPIHTLAQGFQTPFIFKACDNVRVTMAFWNLRVFPKLVHYKPPT